jgi:predicted ferric reductase
MPPDEILPVVDPRSVLVAIAVGLVLVIGLWWVDTPPHLHGMGDWLTNAGRITGLIAGYVIVVQLLLMARVPLLERSIGADRLARWHAIGGRYTINVVVAHALLITWGYSVTAHTGPVHQGVTLLRSYPDVLMATVATLMLIAVGVASARAARQKLKYETWYAIHFYTYVAIALAFSHQFATGADFMRNLPARVAWGGLYLVVAALVVRHRLLEPVRLFTRHRMRVDSVVKESPDVVSIYIRGAHLRELDAVAGQFFRWRFLTRNGWWQSHPFSLSAPPRADLLRITVKALGDHSGELASLKPGTRVWAEGPYGAFTHHRSQRPNVLLLAGGIGITPIRALFETMRPRGSLRLIYRVVSHDDAVLLDELEAIAAHRGARLDVIAGDHRDRPDALSPARLAALVPDLRHYDVYLCGPPGFVEAARRGLHGAGVKSGAIHTEEFAF